MNYYLVDRGQYKIKCYIIEITPLMKKLALDFSLDIILNDNQYNRLLPSDIKDIDIQTKLRIQRTYMGKIAELAFAQFLIEKGIKFSTTGMFQIYEGQENVDSYDFKDKDGNGIDIKCGFRDIHHLLAINLQQFNSKNHKKYYVAIKLNAKDINDSLKTVDINSITKAIILGYAEYDYLVNNAAVKDLGEGPAKIIPYSKLLGIDKLINNF